MANNKILSQLMDDAYNARRVGYGDYKPYGPGQDLPNGLRIQAYINETTKEVAIGTAGTNAVNDFTYANANFAFGGYDDQFREAVKYAFDVKNQIGARVDGEKFTFSVAGHSLGGGVSQVLSHTFGWDGLTADAPAASAVIQSTGYRAQLYELGIEAKGAGNLVNYTEQGSLVSSVPRPYIGDHVEVNLSSDALSLAGGALLTSPLTSLTGASLITYDQWLRSDGQHRVANFVDFFSKPQDYSNIDGYRYVGGTYNGWYRTAPDTNYGQKDWIDRASPEKERELFAERARRLEHNRELEQRSIDAGQQSSHQDVAPTVVTSSILNQWISDDSGTRQMWMRLEDGTMMQIIDSGGGGVIENRYNTATGQLEFSQRTKPATGELDVLLDRRVLHNVAPSADNYTVQRGDTVDGLAARHGLTRQDILDANPELALNPHRVDVGQVINIPGLGSSIATDEDGMPLPENRDGASVSDPYFDPFRQAFDDQAARDAARARTEQHENTQVASNDHAGTHNDAGGDGEATAAGSSSGDNGSGYVAAYTDADTYDLPADHKTPMSKEETASLGSGLLSALSLIQAIQGGNELSATIAALSMLNQFDKAVGGKGDVIPGQYGAGLGAISAGLNLSDALKNHDTLGTLAAGAQLTGQVASLYALEAVAEHGSLQAAAQMGSTSAGVAQGAGYVAGVFGIAYSLEQGNEWGAATSAVAMIPVYGWIASLVMTVAGMMFGIGEQKPPPPPRVWGEGTLLWDDNGELSVAATGGNHAHHKAYKKMQGDFAEQGQAPVRNLLSSIERELEAYVEANPGMGVIPTRLPIIHYEQTRNVVTLTTIDAETGQAAMRSFDAATGFPLDRLSGPEALQTLFQVYIEMAEDNLAIAPDFEVAAAREAYLEALSHPQPVNVTPGSTYQNGESEYRDPDTVTAQRFIPQAGEAEDPAINLRLADGSLLSRTLSGELVAATRSQWYESERTEDGGLRREGGATLSALTLQTAWTEGLADAGPAPTVVFEMGEGYTQTTTLGSGQDLIVVDLNNDDAIQTREVIRSLNQLSAYDANHDGRIDANDPIYSALRLWSETQHDAKAASLLNPRAIDSIDLASGEVRYAGEADAEAAAQRASANTSATKQSLDLTDPKRYTALTGAVLEETLTREGKKDTVQVAGVLRTNNASDATSVRIGVNDARLVSVSDAVARSRDTLARESANLFTGAGGLLTAFAVAPSAGAESLAPFVFSEAPGGAPPALTMPTHRVTLEELAAAPPRVAVGADDAVTEVVVPDLRSVVSDAEPGSDRRSPGAVVPATAPQGAADLPIDNETAHTPVFLSPAVAGETVAAAEDSVLRLDPALLLANDRARSGEGVRVSAVGNADHGTVAFDPDGMIRFTPEGDYFGPASFTYTVTDRFGLESQATFAIELNPVNDAPLATGERASAAEDATLLFDAASLLANDTDIDNAAAQLRLAGVGSATHGTVALDADGRVRFIPEANYYGAASFTYRVADGAGGESEATLAIEFNAVNDAPVATDERVASQEDTILLFTPADLLANDTDVDDDRSALTLTTLGGAVHGSVTRDADGTVRFTPEQNYYGEASFTYTVADAAGAPSQATVTLSVAAVNDAPVAQGEIVTAAEDATLLIDAASLLANDTDVDNTAAQLRIARVDAASHGTVSVNEDGAIRFIPEADYYGLASFAYTVSDGAGGEASSSVELRVTPNVHGTRVVETLENTATRISLSTLLDGAIDNYQGGLRVTQVTNGAHGAAALDDKGTADSADDEVVFTPEANYYNRLYNPTLGRFQDLTTDPTATGLDPYSSALRNETYRDRELAHFSYTVEDQWGNQVTGSTTVGINYHELPTVSTPITIDYADYTYIVGYDESGNPQYFTRTQSSGAHGDLIVDSPYTDAELQFSTLIYASNPGYPAANARVNAQGEWTFIEHTGPPKDFTWKGTFGEAEWLLWARDPAGNEAERLAMLFGGYGDDGDPSRGLPVGGLHGNITQGAYGQTTVPGTGSFGEVGGQGAIQRAAPIALDLDGDGVKLIDLPISVAYFDMAGDGAPRHTGWVDKGDGLLAFDYNGDGHIAEAKEIEFTRHKPGATTDLEGLSAFDTNRNGSLDAEDNDWSRMGVWQDKNSNGVSEAGEFQTLDQAGIASLDLTGAGQPQSQGENVINATTTYTRTDGTQGQAADVALAYEAAPPIEIVRAEPATAPSTVPPDTWEAQIARMALVFNETMAQAPASEAAPLGFVEPPTADLSTIIPPSDDPTGTGGAGST